MSDVKRIPRSSEPWKRDRTDPRIIMDSEERVVAVASAGDREARRIVAAVNAVRKISTDALEEGIIERGLECLYKVHRYKTEEAFRDEADRSGGLDEIFATGKGIFAILKTIFP